MSRPPNGRASRTPERLRVVRREDWRAWLERHHGTEREIWLVHEKKHTGRPRIPYDDAVEEALCFGWIDSIVRRLDEDRYARKFTPRTDAARWSAVNVRRARRLIREGRMTKAGLAVFKPSRAAAEAAPPPRPAGEIEIPPYVARAMKARRKAWETFSRLPPYQRKLHVRWITEAKREETRVRRLEEAVAVLEKGGRIGMK